MAEHFTLKIGGTPKSLNRVAKAKHWAVFQREKKTWEGNIFIALLEAKVPKPLASVYAEASLQFKTARRRDEGNYRSVLEKALGDALQLQWLDDDTPDQFRFGPLHFDDAPGNETLIFLKVERA